LLKGRISDLSSTKQKKNEVLQVQNKEADALEKQQQEKAQLVAKLKAQGKELNNQIAAKNKQMQKVNAAITAAINRAIKEAKEAAAAKAREEKKRKDAETAGSKNTGSNSTATAKAEKKKTEAAPAVKQTSVLLATEADVTLNTSFVKNRGNLPWPVSSGYLLLHFGQNKLESGVTINSQGISIGCDVGSPVKAIFEGEVMLVNGYDDVQMVVIKHGKYFTGYSNITGVSVSKGQVVKVGQVIGRSAANLDGIGAVDLQISNEHSDENPEAWLKRR
jgi:murein hydrolase activator